MRDSRPCLNPTRRLVLSNACYSAVFLLPQSLNNFSSMEAVAAAAGEAALSVAFEALFGKLSSQDVLKYARRNKVESEINRWKKELVKMKCVLDNAEERQMGEDPIKIWLDELGDLAYDVEDILDEFSTQVMRERVMAETETSLSKVRKLISICLSCVGRVKFNASMGSKMEKITQRFESLAKEKEGLKLLESARVPPKKLGVPTRESTSLPEPHVYGREADKETLIRKLLSSDYNGEPVSVVAIVGMGGLGKTTMAQLLYHDDIVSRSFEIKAWVCVSDEFEELKLTLKIIEGFTSSTCNANDLNGAQEKLKAVVNGKKFLLVLDDLWNEEYLRWEALIRPLAAGGSASRVLITTRNDAVAATAGAAFTYPLKKLNSKECSSLLARHALGENDFSGHLRLKETGEAIAKRCDGLPLAAKAIGGLLRGRPNPGEWVKVLESHMWELPLDKCPILPALRLSYYYLPSHLKRCFAYCAIFPKDHEFKKDELILWWKGEGFLEQSTDFMELGSGYFQDLLSRSFFQPSADSKFVMHDLMNDLSMWINARICFHLPHDKAIASCPNFQNLRCLSFMSHGHGDAERLEKCSSSTKLRTLIAFVQLVDPCSIRSTFDNMIAKMAWLKVLCLRGYVIDELPSSISELKLLRHLDMSFTRIRFLPESISNLLNLQILKLNCCESLIQLPREIRKLINLQLLDISNTNHLKAMPSGIDRLTNLQILPKFIIGNSHGLRLKELKGLSLIRGDLSVSRLERVVDIQDAKDADLRAKKGLVSLKLQWSADLRTLEEEKHEQILAQLCPPTSLKSLGIEGYNGGHFPGWVGDSNFTDLETLTLRDCNNVSSLSSIAGLISLKTLDIACSNLTNLPNQLPLLETLKIKGCSKLRNLPNHLHLLRKLTIEGCSNLTNLPDELPMLGILNIEGWLSLKNLPVQLPCLEELCIRRGCSNLTNLPDQLPLLRMLSIEGCSSLKNLPDQLPLLRMLSIEGCSNLPDQLPLLRMLSIEGCSSLKNLPDQLPLLTILNIEGCSSLKNLPDQLPLLRMLSIEGCSSLKNLPNQLPSLEELNIQGGYSKLSSLPEGLPLLRFLGIEGFSNETDSPDQLPLFDSPSIEGCSNLSNVLPSLVILTIKGCSNLTKLPNQLPSLTQLNIKGCSNLTALPDQLPSLEELIVKDCPNLPSVFLHSENGVLKRGSEKCKYGVKDDRKMRVHDESEEVS